MSSICPRFAQNAWKKDLCSNCFKSKEEHKIPIPTVPKNSKKLDIAKKYVVEPPKGIMKGIKNKTKKFKVNFPKELTEVIGYGGEWSENDASEEEEEEEKDNNTPINGNDENLTTDDDEQELQKLTKTNTDFNTNNGNLLGDPEENIKKSFAALKLGTPQVDSAGKKQTLKITVTPFGTPTKISSTQTKYEDDKRSSRDEVDDIKSDIRNSPPVERVMDKSLLEEISETLEQNKKDVRKIESDKHGKIKFEISSQSNYATKLSSEIKKSIARNAPITKDHAKPKINVFSKFSDSDASDNENGISAYYDVVETNESNSYENVPDGYVQSKDHTIINNKTDQTDSKSIYSTSQFITDMLLSAKTHAASYSLHDRSYMTSKITSDGLIVTKCNSDDALDSTGSSFDSSDEEASYNMNRSESDSGIGISIGSTEYQMKLEKEKKSNNSDNSSDYEDIQISTEKPKTEKVFAVEKSREMAGEPDGSADPDGNVEKTAPALPKSPPPITADARISFLHGMQKNVTNKKPEVPAKPSINVMKTFSKRQPTTVEQQVMTQLQQVMKQPIESPEKLTISRKEGIELSKQIRKGRAPNPPPNSSDDKTSNPSTPEKEYNEDISFEFKMIEIRQSDEKKDDSKSSPISIRSDDQHGSIYTRNPTVGIKSNSPVIREKDKRERATVNPKFRSLNTFNTNRKSNQLIKPSTPEPSPRKILSMSEECLADDKKKKNKFSIKKFLRMGSSKTTDNLQKKEGIYSEIVTGDDPTISGKPRLVIIHPIDINPTAVEVVKDIGKTNETSIPIVTGKPPAPPQRTGIDSQRLYDLNKPARPPPPKSAELRRKQKIGFNIANSTIGSVRSKSDNVYANLGEIRSAIAPRKPERTASMREREAQLELARKRQGNENSDTISVCSSSNGGTVQNNEISINPSKIMQNKEFLGTTTHLEVTKDEKLSTSERKKKLETETKLLTNNKLEIFEKNIQLDVNSKLKLNDGKSKLNDGLKNSVLKINNTIDSYLKDKRDYESMYDTIKSAPPVPARNIDTELRRNFDSVAVRNKVRTSLQDAGSISGASYTRSEYGPRHGFNSLANIPRVVSASYCGSEMGESDIYSPYSFFGSETGGDVANDMHDGVWGIQSTSKSRVKTTNRLRMRKGRSVVHKTIEDNYSAVIVANHEALAQVLDQLQQSPIIPLQLRPLANTINLRFEDFNILEGVQAFVVGKRAFHSAIWANSPVTLALSGDCNQISGVSGDLNQLSGGISGALNPITEFCDLVPSYHLPLMPSTEVRMLQSTISVLPRLHLDTLQSLGILLKNKSKIIEKHNNNLHGSIPNLVGSGQKDQQNGLRNVHSVQNLSTLNEENHEKDTDPMKIPGIPSFDDIMCREIGFIMLQLVNGLKNLQAKAIEEIPLSLSNVILCKEIDNKEAQARLCVLHGINQDEDEPMGTLCKCAYTALTEMLPLTKLTPILSEILIQERSESLSKVKSVLEFILWGPSDVVLNGSTKERELALQRWLDLERATVLHGLVRTRIELTVYDECHLMFLVRSNAKTMNEAAKIVSSFKNNNE